MTKEMKGVCQKFEEVTGWRIPVVERAGILVRSIAKAEPLKMEGCKRLDCFPCTSGGGNCEKKGYGIKLDARPATRMEYQVYMREKLVAMHTRGAENT